MTRFGTLAFHSFKKHDDTMVVPVLDATTPQKRRFVGSNLHLDFDLNRCRIAVIGNNCLLKVAVNAGTIDVIGNNCTVEVDKCPGSIRYTGINGTVYLGDSNDASNITCVGTKCRIVPLKEKQTSQSKLPDSYLDTVLQNVQSGDLKDVDSAFIISGNVRTLQYIRGRFI